MSKIQNIIYEFSLPYSLDLKDNFKRGNESYIVSINNIPAQIRTERIYIKYDNLLLDIKNCKIDNDRYGLISKTKVQIWFDEKIIKFGLIDKNLYNIDTDKGFLLGLEYLNKFIQNYKNITKEFWISKIKPEYVLNYNFCTLDNIGNIVDKSVHSLSFHIGQFNGGKEFFIGEDLDKKLRERLLKKDYNLQDELLLEIYNNYDLGNYNLVIIQNSILFENYVYDMLKNILSNAKLNKIKKKENCGCFIGIYGICTKGFTELGFNFENTEEFKNFYKYVLKLRNKLIHGEKIDSITELEAKMSIDYTHNAINCIYNNLKSYIK